MAIVRIEVSPGFSDTLDKKGSNPAVFNRKIRENATVGEALGELAKDNSAFSDAVFSDKPETLSGQVAVVLNDRLLESLKGLATRVEDGDVIKLMPVISGG
ncbi:MoaD/ThiS family protein [Chloroflexota bacterium]